MQTSYYFRLSIEIALILFDSNFIVKKTVQISIYDHVTNLSKITAAVSTINYSVLFSFQRVSRNTYNPSKLAS